MRQTVGVGFQSEQLGRFFEAASLNLSPSHGRLRCTILETFQQPQTGSVSEAKK